MEMQRIMVDERVEGEKERRGIRYFRAGDCVGRIEKARERLNLLSGIYLVEINILVVQDMLNMLVVEGV